MAEDREEGQTFATKLEHDQWRYGREALGAVEFIKSVVTEAIAAGDLDIRDRLATETAMVRTYLEDAPDHAALRLFKEALWQESLARRLDHLQDANDRRRAHDEPLVSGAGAPRLLALDTRTFDLFHPQQLELVACPESLATQVRTQAEALRVQGQGLGSRQAQDKGMSF